MGAVFEQVRFATGSWTISHLVLGAILGGVARFTIAGSTLGYVRWCNGNICTLGGGRGGVGGKCRLDTPGDRRRGNIFQGAIGLGWFSGVPGYYHRWHASYKALIALSWASYTAMGVSLMAPVSILMLWRMRLAGVTVAAVIY